MARTRDDYMTLAPDELVAERGRIMAQKRDNADILAWLGTDPGKREVGELALRLEMIRDEYGQALRDLASENAEVIVRALVAIRSREQECATRYERLKRAKDFQKALDKDLEVCNSVIEMHENQPVTGR